METCNAGHIRTVANTYLNKGKRYCKVCRTKSSRDWELRDYNGRDQNLKARYGRGFGQQAFLDLLAHQGGICAICGVSLMDKRPNQMHVDHDHLTGAIRGILCASCNLAIGKLGDDPHLVAVALAYLTEGITL